MLLDLRQIANSLTDNGMRATSPCWQQLSQRSPVRKADFSSKWKLPHRKSVNTRAFRAPNFNVASTPERDSGRCGHVHGGGPICSSSAASAVRQYVESARQGVKLRPGIRSVPRMNFWRLGLRRFPLDSVTTRQPSPDRLVVELQGEPSHKDDKR